MVGVQAVPKGRQDPPSTGQQVVPNGQSIAAQTFGSTGIQMPGQSAPKALGSHESLGSSMQMWFGGHGVPKYPPQETIRPGNSGGAI